MNQVRKRWNNDETRGQVERIFGRDQLEKVRSCLQALNERIYFSEYHYRQANYFIKKPMEGRTSDEAMLVFLGVFDEDDEPGAWEHFRFSHAHAFACVQNLHSLPDHLAYFAYWALGMDLDEKTRIQRLRDITRKEVNRRLPEPLKEVYSQLVADESFVYIDDLNNHSKHRSLIKVSYQTKFEIDQVKEHGLQFGEFTFGDRSYPARWVLETLRKEHNRQSKFIVAFGNELNATLQAMPARVG
ncbi:hypothetical protein U0039_06570 [Stenotrophomonas maltophilia]|nr:MULTISPECIES: hypothetical protein [Stenotrophomonas]OMP38424.1 hypothetical protein BMR86_18165 [Stenotrophomonas sp. KAs 5-3]AIL10457.1 hypothetical protein DP16_1261 [Stenotrophomonas maltophilia]EKT4071011.1 hypothetical protein [Stenotrophomonas maltophilia]EKT4074476.1 hypothetical protein [Stenotrophomonas maltophilia]EKT4077863.1 hypothetical protein [Stenotrophomonas maltophilia]